MGWLGRHSGAIQAVAAMLTFVVALAAIVGVKVQIDAAADLQQAQAARELYRESLVLSVQNPDLAEPADACALMTGPKGPAYAAFVDHLLYTAEEVLAQGPEWTPVFVSAFATHSDYLCAAGLEPDGYTSAVALILQDLQRTCPTIGTCG